MTNRNKIAGSAAERAVVNYLRAEGFPHAERRLAGAQKDRGDIAGIPGVAIEVKSGARVELAQWLDEASVERDNDHADLGVVWHRRRGIGSAGAWFVTMDGATFARMLHELGYSNTRTPRGEAA